MSPRGSRRGRSTPRNAGEAIEALLRDELERRRGFSAGVEREAERAAAAAPGASGPRRDLTETPTFTVDPASARDFDDAVSASREGEKIRLWIHIADVAAHVRPGSPLDREARRRGNSTYAPGTVEPMLPGSLSEGACSLSPDVERLAVSTEVVLGRGGVPLEASFYRSRIRSDARLDYDRLDQIFAGRSPAPDEVAEPIAIAREAATALAESRSGGALDVESAEPEFELNRRGDVVAARSVPQTESHRLIERLMILANEQVASFLEERRAPTVYRVHGRPDATRVERLVAQLHDLGVPTPPLRGGTLAPSEAAAVAVEASRLVRKEASRRGHGREAYTSLVLRSLQQAQYSDRNSGHAGLGSTAYCHFTSPIRRYPDLVVHRALLAELGEGEEAPRAGEVRDVARLCSERERDSMRIERSADDICAAFLLERELGGRRDRGEPVFKGEISGTIRSGAFVNFGGKLGDVYEGFLAARRMPEDFYVLNETETALVGRDSGRALRLGDPISVRVAGVEAARGRVDLVTA